MIEDFFQSPVAFNVLDNQLKFNQIVGICNRSREAFQHFSRVVARQMLKYHFPIDMQSFLDQFLLKVKSAQTKDQYLQMYDDDLINYVLICDVAQSDNAAQGQVENWLGDLRQQNFENFIILCTHFPKFLHLLRT